MTLVFEKMASLSGFTPDDARQFLEGLDLLSPIEVGGVLGYLLGRMNGSDAYTFAAEIRRQHPQRTVCPDLGLPIVNIVGSGGGMPTFNITTITAFVVAAAGVVVLKTGSAAYRSTAGFADVAARLGT